MKIHWFPLCFIAGLLLAIPELFAAADLAPIRPLIAEKNFTAASAALEKIVAAEPAHADAWLTLGDVLLSRVNKAGLLDKVGLATRGADAYRKAARLDPTSVRARVSLIGYYSQAPFFVGGDREKARATARELVALEPFTGHFWLMQLALKDDQPVEAFAACEAILKLEPESYRARCALGRTVATTGEQLDRGAGALRSAVAQPRKKNDPTLADVHEWLGQILEKKGDKAGAIAAYQAALNFEPKHAKAGERLAKLK